MLLEQMTRDEKSLLLYIETCAVDSGGLIESRRVSKGDIEQLKAWDAAGFVSFGRLTRESIESLSTSFSTHLVRLSDAAWTLAHQERRARGIRMAAKSPYCDLITITEPKAVGG